MARKRFSAVLVALLLTVAANAEAAQCGSALLLEVSPPAVFDAVDPAAPSVVRFWEAGLAGSNRGDVGCRTGCTVGSGAQCSGGGDCIALTGVNWLNASCAVPGRLPLRTVFLIEQSTPDTGGRWAAINLDRNAEDANTALDAKAAGVCGGCASVVSSYLGGDGRPAVTGSSAGGGDLTVALSWTTPPAEAQALSNGLDLVTGYAIYYRTDVGTPPPASGDPTGWTRAADTEPDGASNDGFSNDVSAMVAIPLTGLQETVTFAVGPLFDGTGNPLADADTLVSAYLSDQSDPLVVPTSCGEPNDLLLQNQTVDDTQEFVGCLTVTAGGGFAVGPTGVVSFRAGQSIVLQDGFSVAEGGRFDASIDPTLSE